MQKLLNLISDVAVVVGERRREVVVRRSAIEADADILDCSANSLTEILVSIFCRSIIRRRFTNFFPKKNEKWHLLF